MSFMPSIETVVFVLTIPVFILDLVTFVLIIAWDIVRGKPMPGGLTQQQLQSGGEDDKNKILYSLPRGEATATHGAPRSKTADEPLVETFGEYKTIYEMILASVQTYGPSKHVAMQSRKFVDMKKLHDNDRFPTKIFDDSAGLEEITYEELGQSMVDFGAGLRELGMEPVPSHDNPQDYESLKGPFKLVLFESTCAEWTMAHLGALSQSMTVATCYATLGHDAVVSAVVETEAAALFVNWKDVNVFVKRQKEMPSLKAVIASTNEMPKDVQIARPDPKTSSVQVFTFDEVLAMGKANKYEPTPPKPSDVAVIMYTSGSTGKPKGVIMRHSQLVAGIGGMVTNVQLRPGQERFVSYLPLAHILALQIEHVLLSVGATLCYTDPREMAKSISMFKPTIFAGVPKVFEMLKAGLEKKLDKGPPAMKAVYNTLLGWKIDVLQQGGNTPVSNLFFDLISKTMFGGKLQFAITGGGPIGPSLHYFARACFNCPVVQGYALTETCVGGCFQALHDTRNGVVGPPVPCVEIMLQSEPELKDSAGLPYLHTDTVGSKGEKVLGRGEICMRGPCISSGYFKNPTKTKEEYDEEGFFHTGDIGQFTDDGVIQIIDRKKNLVKLKGGEYVAVEAMESAFVTSKFVSSLCVIANGDLDAPLALVVPDHGALKQWAASENITYNDLKELGEKEEARQAVVKSMVAEGKQAGLTSLELRLKDCCLITYDEWGPGHGMTASMKLDRKGIYKIHEKELKTLYDRNGVQV